MIKNDSKLQLSRQDLTAKGVAFHCAKSVQTRIFFWSVFTHFWTEYRPEKTPCLDSFHAVSVKLSSGDTLTLCSNGKKSSNQRSKKEYFAMLLN